MRWKRILRFSSEQGRFRLRDITFHFLDELQKSPPERLQSELSKLREKEIEKVIELQTKKDNDGVEDYRKNLEDNPNIHTIEIDSKVKDT